MVLHDNYTRLLRAQGKFYGWPGMEWLFGSGWSWYAILAGAILATPVLAVCRMLGFNPLLQVALVLGAGWAAAQPIPTADGRRVHDLAIAGFDWLHLNARALLGRVVNPPRVQVVVRAWLPHRQDES